MEPRISIIIPTRSRPQGLLRVLESIWRTCAAHEIEIIVVADAPDTETLAMLGVLAERSIELRPLIVGAEYLGRPQDKYNRGYGVSRGEWIVLAADDIEFHADWLDAALAAAADRPWVIGLFDGIHEAFATLFMLHRSAVQELFQGKVGLPWYHVWMADMEMTCRAEWAGRYVLCREARFTHHHPLVSAGETDAIYALASTWYDEDRMTYARRLAAQFPDPDVAANR